MAGDIEMRYRRLGRTGLAVSRLCLGTMNFGPKTEEIDAHRIMDGAHEHGINFFDTANVYGWQTGEGITEQIIGRWFASGGGRRERTVLATKVYGSMGPWPNEDKLSALNIRRACEGSLRRLQTDYIDLYQMHHVDRETPFEEIWEAMEVLRQQGKVLYVGSSNFAGWHIAKAQEAAARRNFMGLVCEQSLYNLVRREIEMEVIPAAEDYGLGVIAYSPLAGGLLGGVHGKSGDGGRRFDARAQAELDACRHQVAAYEQLCSQLGEQPGVLALAWLLTRPGLTAPIVGPRTLEQLEESLRAITLADDLGVDALAAIDAIFPPHRPAPEDYAW